MLTVMTSLASPVHADTALNPTLIGFYATVATVIPVMFIAVAIQGTTYQEILRLWRQSLRGPRLRPRLRPSSRVLRFVADQVYWLVGQGIFFAAAFILVAGGYGEFLAIYALYQDRDQMDSRRLVLQLATLLIIMVVAGPTVALLRIVWRPGRDDDKAAHPAARTKPAATPSAEPDKPGTKSDKESRG